MPSLKTKVAGIELENPTILASGILGQTGKSLLRVVEEGGAAGTVTKSIGAEPRDGHGTPTLIELDNSLLNAMGLPNPGIEEYGREIEVARSSGKPIFGSIFSSSPDGFADLGKKMASYGVQAVELNLSCPHAEKVGLEVGTDPQMVFNIVKAVKNVVNVPVLAKLSPMVPDIAVIARAVDDAGGDGIVAINTLKAMKIEPDIGKPVLQNVYGGLSGPAVKPVGVRCVYDIAKAVKIPVIGVGGINTGQDALEYIMAGASAVQIGSGVHYRGLDVFKKVCGEIEEFMATNGYGTIEEIIGLAHGD